jgi:hypothetical protein
MKWMLIVLVGGVTPTAFKPAAARVETSQALGLLYFSADFHLYDLISDRQGRSCDRSTSHRKVRAGLKIAFTHQ